MASDKTSVVEYLFDQRWDEAANILRNPVVTQKDVQEAIRHCNAQDGKSRSDRNPANFMKDIVRKDTASQQWPEKLKGLRYTAVQRTSGGNSFEFVPYEAGQTEPFPDLYKPRPGINEAQVQSLSMLSESKMLGRRDEAWLTQTAVNLRVVETHFALFSPVRVADVIHLQMSVKLRQTEIDAIFMARIRDTPAGEFEEIAITCEAKQAKERVLEWQIVEQVKAAFDETPLNKVIPIAIRAVKNKGIYVVQFDMVDRLAAAGYSKPILATEAVYSLKPAVRGI